MRQEQMRQEQMRKNQSEWTIDKIRALYDTPLLELVGRAIAIHSQFHDVKEVQVCHLISIKTGGCSEDCHYCAQSSRYQTGVKAQPMMRCETVLEEAKKSIAQGATRICLGSAWRGVREGKPFEEILKMVKGIAQMGVEVCCTLGFLNDAQAKQLKAAGLYAYNHNLDTSKRFYQTIVQSHSYEERLKTLDTVEKAGISLCCGGIIGMGETVEDRLELLLTLSRRPSPPESIPINQLTPIPGTPLEKQSPLPFWDVLRMIATTRMVFKHALIRLSAGRIGLSILEQALLFLVGANSIFAGEKLLTVANTPIDTDKNMFECLGLKKRPPYVFERSTK